MTDISQFVFEFQNLPQMPFDYKNEPLSLPKNKSLLLFLPKLNEVNETIQDHKFAGAVFDDRLRKGFRRS